MSKTTHKLLTPEILKKLPFTFQMHINGGSKFSKSVTLNEEWRLSLVTTTNGSPQYKLTGKDLVFNDDPKISLDLLHGIPNYEAFCEAYNLKVA